MNGAVRRRAAGALLAMAMLAPPVASANQPLIDRQTQERINGGLGLLQGLRQSFRQDADLAPLERQRRAYGVVEHPPLDQALARVMESLRRAAGGNAPAARIHVTPDPGLHAYATEEGSIFIAVGMLRSMETEDELAALVAHEYAHVLRRHAGRSALQRTKDIAAGLSALYMDYEYGDQSVRASRPETAFIRSALLREAAMHSVQSGIVPGRARVQEDEADRIGVDLMVAAGYNPVGMVEMLGRLDAWEAQRKAAADAAGQPAAQGGVADAAVRYARRSDQARSARRSLDGDSTGIVDAVITSLADSTRRGVSRAGRSHRDSDARIELVMEHIQARHGDRERPDMRPMPWAGDAQAASLFESIDLVQALIASNDGRLSRPGPEQAAALRRVAASPAGQTPLGRYVMLRYQAPVLGSDEGTAAWQQELTRRDSLFAAHRLVLDLSSRLRPEPAVGMFETSRQSLDDPPELLPYGIRIHRRAGNAGVADGYAARCRGTGNEALRNACAKAR